jgi:LuxR family transcriptional regulator, maltose regulon positive regulatory protein
MRPRIKRRTRPLAFLTVAIPIAGWALEQAARRAETRDPSSPAGTRLRQGADFAQRWGRGPMADRLRRWPTALDALSQAEPVQLSPVVVDLLNPVPAQRARLALAQDDLDAAAGWARARGLSATDDPGYPREREYLVLARVLLATQAPEPALGLLERLGARAAAQGRTGSVIEVRALQALARHRIGDERGALTALAEALTLAAPEGYLRVFVDEGPPMAALLRQLLAGRRQDRPAAGDAVPRDSLARLVEAVEQAGLPVRPPVRSGGVVVAGLVEPLSPRELEVLGLLADGRSNQAIASQLVITLDTVKRHLSNLFSKLEVANRTQAVARARDLRLLP